MRTPLILALVASITAHAADINPENSKRIAELRFGGMIEETIAMIIPQIASAAPAQVSAKIQEKYLQMRQSGEFARLGNQIGQDTLSRLSNEELAAYHAMQTRPEAASNLRKSALCMAEVMPLVADEMMFAMGQRTQRTKFEIEEPWDIVPKRRREVMRELAPLQATLSEELQQLGIGGTDKGSKAPPGSIQAQRQAIIEQQLARFDQGRVIRAIEEAHARRLTTAEAEWRLESLKNPAYVSAEKKVMSIIQATLQSSLRR